MRKTLNCKYVGIILTRNDLLLKQFHDSYTTHQELKSNAKWCIDLFYDYIIGWIIAEVTLQEFIMKPQVIVSLLGLLNLKEL